MSTGDVVEMIARELARRGCHVCHGQVHVRSYHGEMVPCPECWTYAKTFVREAQRSAPPQAYLALDLWQALHLPVGEFDGYFERNGWGTTWPILLHEVRGPATCTRLTDDGEPCVLSPHSETFPCYGAGDVGSSEPLPAPTRPRHPGSDPLREALAALHPRVKSSRCRYRTAVDPNPPPGPPDMPRWCVLSAGHPENKHISNAGGFLRGAVLGPELRDQCSTCHTAWPCKYGEILDATS